MQNQNYNQGQPMQQNQQSDKDFVNGLFTDYVNTNYGTITKLGIHRDNFINWLMQQRITEKGYVNIDIKTNKTTGNPYAELNTYVFQQNNMGQPQQYQQQPQTPPAYTGNMGPSTSQVVNPPQYQQPMPNEPVYTQQPGPAVQQAPQQGYPDTGQATF